MEPWKIISEDGRFNMTMTPTFDHHTDLNVGVARMNAHQVHGCWNGDVTLDDGTKLSSRDLSFGCKKGRARKVKTVIRHPIKKI